MLLDVVSRAIFKILSKNDWILYNLNNTEHSKFVESVRLYGALNLYSTEVIFKTSLTWLPCNLQEYLSDIEDEDFDPKLASTIKLIDYEN